MVKGGKQHSSMSTDGKWFAHPVLAENETRSRETCTSTGIMLTQVKTSQDSNPERYTKTKTPLQKAREYPFSEHDSKHTLRDNISVFTLGVGRKKCLEGDRQHNSNFCLCRDGADDGHAEEEEEVRAAGKHTASRSDFMAEGAVGGPNSSRRFTRNHRQKSLEAATAQEEQAYMWFGRHDCAGRRQRLKS